MPALIFENRKVCVVENRLQRIYCFYNI